MPDRRDRFPKINLRGGYIGDRVPLCTDLPPQSFLRKGAKFRYLGGSATPVTNTEPPWHSSFGPQLELVLEADSALSQHHLPQV